MGEEIKFNCPYCGELNITDFFSSDGSNQTFIHDCEVCCRPIEINIIKDREGNLSVNVKNDEGYL